MKRLIGIILSLIMCIGCFSITSSAEISSPELVRTEMFNTTYSVGGNTYTGSGCIGPYYCTCVCDTYSDGTLYVYIIYDNLPVGDVTIRLNEHAPIKESGCYKYSQGLGTNWSVTHVYGSNWFPDLYNIEYNGFVMFDGDANDSNKDYKYFYNEPTEYIDAFGLVRSDCFPDANIVTSTQRPETTLSVDTRTTNNYIMKLYTSADIDRKLNFRLFGHDITITPELLSGNIISEPELTEQEKYMKQLEEENAKLKASTTNANSFGDINGDNLVDVADAQMILNYYVYTLVNDNAESLEEWISKQ